MNRERNSVSVITPALNAERFITETISSIQAQTHENWELLVVDDGSTDGTIDIVCDASRSDSRVRLLRSDGHRGIAPARNLGLRNAAGRYVAFLDSDDLWDATKLERQLTFMNERESVFSFSAYRLITEGGQLLGRARAPSGEIGYRDMLRGQRVGCLTVMLDASRLGTLQFPSFPKASDLGLWLEILAKGHVAHGLEEELATYRVVSKSVSRNKIKYVGRVWDIYRAQPLPKLDLAWLYAQYAVSGLIKHVSTGAFRVNAG
jgi:teichuronic acid biosynthesis glycosyltransferase TuaG